MTFVEHQYVRDLRPEHNGRLGVTYHVSDGDYPVVSVDWSPVDTRCELETLREDRIEPARGPVRQVEELFFPPPSCPYCTVDLEHKDGDGWDCPTCRTQWDEHGVDGERICVECFDAATVIDPDGRTRCAKCTHGEDT